MAFNVGSAQAQFRRRFTPNFIECLTDSSLVQAEKAGIEAEVAASENRCTDFTKAVLFEFFNDFLTEVGLHGGSGNGQFALHPCRREDGANVKSACCGGFFAHGQIPSDCACGVFL